MRRLALSAFIVRVKTVFIDPMRKFLFPLLALLCFLGLMVTQVSGESKAAGTPTGVFVIRCDASHIAQADPIVSPGGLSAHEHQFFGNTTTNANSTFASMQAGGTTCKDKADTAGYWRPTLCLTRNAATNTCATYATSIFSFAYYRNNAGGPVKPFPPDFRMIAGGLQNPTQMFWSCFNTGGHSSVPLNCSGGGSGNYLQVRVRFPDCNDGRTDSPDHRSHMVYDKKGICPADHPIKLPTINMFFRFASTTPASAVFSDGTTNLHADFWNTWQDDAQEALVTRCINAGINCGQVTG